MQCETGAPFCFSLNDYLCAPIRLATGARFRHCALRTGRYDDGLTASQMGLHMDCVGYESLRLLRYCGHTAAPTPSGDYPSGASDFRGGQCSSRAEALDPK